MVQAFGTLAFEQGDREVEFLPLQPCFYLRLLTCPQSELEVREAFAHLLQHSRQVVPERDHRGGHPQDFPGITSEPSFHIAQLTEEGADKLVEIWARWQQFKRASAKELHS